MMFRLKSITREFDDVKALDGLDLTVHEGEILAVVGPSGSGKTTLMRLLNLLDRPDGGTLTINGKEPWYQHESWRLRAMRDMSMVFQNPVLLRRTVLSNVMYGLMVRREEREEAGRRAKEALDKVRLGDKADQFAPTLSAGEGQRMAFARATVFQPHALFLDEFTANLDPANVALLERAVVQYNVTTGATVVLATHNLFQAKRIAHRTAVLIDGRLVEVGPTVEIFNRPRKKKTGDFTSGRMAW